MATPKIKIGTVLIAVDKCQMIPLSDKDIGTSTLTIGKEYTVLEVDDMEASLKIINDNTHGHYFTLDTLSTYFTIKQY